MKVIYFLLLYVFIASAHEEEDVNSEIEENRLKLLKQLTKTHTVLLDGFHLVTRRVATDVYTFRNYRTVSVIFYPIMRGVTDAHFTFQSEELHLNNIGSCEPQEVIVNVKRGSYPAVNPDGYDFPKLFIKPELREKIYTTELMSDGRNRSLVIKNPKPGNWYALVYIKWVDPRTEQVSQEGLTPRCDTVFYTDLQVKREDEGIELIDCYAGISLDITDLPAFFKCMSIDSLDPIVFNLTVTNSYLNDVDVLFTVQAQSLPTEDDYLVSCAFNPKDSNVQTINFFPNPSTWHYIHVHHVFENTSKYVNCESYSTAYFDEPDNNTVYNLMRDDKGRFFAFDYGLATAQTNVQDSTSLLNLTSNAIQTLRFRVNQFIDIGGSLILEASFLMSLKYYMGYRRQMKQGALLAFTEENQFFKVVICLDMNHGSVPLESGNCKYNDRVTPALFVLNSTDSESIYDKLIVPFPDSGTWYLSLKLFCDESVCPCKTSHNGTKYYVDSDTVTKEGEDLSGEISNNTREGSDNCNATVLLSISSSSCVNGGCSNHGRCLLNTFGGLVMSFCSCTAGYGAWDCSDDSRMDSRGYMLLSVLLLTLSNLLFFLSIYVAIIRKYYTEATMYTFTMVFSTFYHACDAPAQVAYCIVRGNILQFADFYSGIMSFWVTLLAMSIINDRFRSALQLIGAIIVALLTTWNMHSIVTFLLPVAVGVVLLFISWYVDWRRTRRMRYPRSYYTRMMPVGLILVSVGLVCYAFLQTEQNYKIVHSVWHMIIALSVSFLLPDVKRGLDKNPFLPSQTHFKFNFGKLFSWIRNPKRSDTANQTASNQRP